MRQSHARATRWVIGCMSGTSMDAVDGALVRITGRGLRMRAQLLATASAPLLGGDRALLTLLRRAAGNRPLAGGDFVRLARTMALDHVSCIKVLRQQTTEPIDFLAIHGQTIFHAPPLSWQLLDAATIAHRTGLPVVHDLRQADLAAGGQGAPITPLADWILFRHRTQTRVVANLGGFVNLTRLPAGQGTQAIRGGDVCLCNQLLDRIARQRWRVAFDVDGQRARRGRVQRKAMADLKRTLSAQHRAGRSLGTLDVLDHWTQTHAGLASADLARTAVEAIAATVANAIMHDGPVDRVILAGGGARHGLLVERLSALCPCDVQTSDAHGVPVQAREALAMAILGALCQDGQPITLPQITAAGSPGVAGCWTLAPDGSWKVQP